MMAARHCRRALASLARAAPRERVTVRVPATSANMGPGFDCLGIALTEHNFLSVERSSRFELEIHGEGADSLPVDESNYYYRAFKLGYAASAPAGAPIPPVKLQCTNAIPPARGLGSSSACLVAGVSAGFALNGLDPAGGSVRNRVFQICAEQEGHPDNVAPAIYGGLQLSFLPDERGRFLTQAVRIHLHALGATAVLFVPDFELPTHEARALLKPEVTRYARAARVHPRRVSRLRRRPLPPAAWSLRGAPVGTPQPLTLPPACHPRPPACLVPIVGRTRSSTLRARRRW
jgi:homoserine kinase